MSDLMPTYFISHGGGPWPWVPEMRKVFSNLEQSFLEMVRELPERPRAVLMISGHWEADVATVMAAPRPPMVYDYFGFPPETYQITYPANGAPDIAERARSLLTKAGITAVLDHTQGFDHGTFVPMHIMYPQADMPLFQISLLKSYDPEAHVRIGRALAPLRKEGVLIVGSGLSFHNLSLFGTPQAKDPSDQFDTWLNRALAKPPAERMNDVLNWEQAPAARICHKEEDHLVPLFVALGAAEGETATRVYHETGLFNGVTASSYRFGTHTVAALA